MVPPQYAYRLGWRSLKHVVPSLTSAEAQALARDLGQAMHDFEINTRARAAMFVAQLAHESVGFHRREEIASGAAYDITVNPKLARSLGNIHPGDGKRYKGRTYIQITGRNNYAAVSKALGVDFVTHPSKLAEPQYAAKAAAWWWKTHGCNGFADGNDFVGLTKRINGGLNGLESRQAFYGRARLVSPFLVPKRRKP